MAGVCKPDWATIMSFAPKNGKSKKTVKTAVCKACGKEKPISLFYLRAGGYRETYACKACKRKAARGRPRYGGWGINAKPKEE